MFLKNEKFDLKLEDFEPIPEARHPQSCFAISILPNGDVRLNDRFQREILRHTDLLKLGFHINGKDPRFLRIFITETPNYSFPKNGSRKDRNFTQSLVQKGIALPAKYVAEWSEEFASWIAVFDEELKPDALAKTLIKAGRRGGKHD